MTARTGRDFRERAEQVEPDEILQHGVWYRSPLWNHDHLLGRPKEWFQDEIAWCGRALGEARDMEDTGYKQSLGGLWVGQRTSAKCSTCKRKEKEWKQHYDPR